MAALASTACMAAVMQGKAQQAQRHVPMATQALKSIASAAV